MSDGREGVHRDIEKFARGVEAEISASLEAAGHEVVRASEPVWTNRLAVGEARRIAAGRPDLTVFNIPLWAFPHFSMLASEGDARAATLVLQHRPRATRDGRHARRGRGA
jgi:L-fucose/D-arabinose isomerase